MREMRESGVEWIGTMPVNWQLTTIGSMFKVRNEKVNDTDYPPLSVTKGGIVPQMENVAKSDANDNRKMVLANDFVINSRSDRNWTFREYGGIVLCYKEVQHYATYKKTSKIKRNDRITGNDLGDAVVLLCAEGRWL